MDRLNLILQHHLFQQEYNKLIQKEKCRVYCRHTLEHFLSLARIAYIMVLEKNLCYNKEIIYAIGILHDIGKNKEYEKGVPHEIASAMIASDILPDCNFDKTEIEIIVSAIKAHRSHSLNELHQIVYTADKLTRNCLECLVKDTCKWQETKKNMIIKY